MSSPLNSNTTKTVLFYGISTQLGGAERSLLELIEGMKGQSHLRSNANWKIQVLLPDDHGPLVQALRSLQVEVRVLPMAPALTRVSRSSRWGGAWGVIQAFPALLKYLFHLKRVVQSLQPDVIHTTGIKCHLFAWGLVGLFSFRFKPRVVWHLRDILTQRPIQTLFRLLVKLRPVEVIYNSYATQASWKLSAPSQVIYNGLDPIRYSVAPHAELKIRLGLAETQFLVGMVGVWSRWKGQLEFIRAAKRVLEAGQDVYFVLVGGKIYNTVTDPDYEKQVLDEIRTLGLSERVRVIDFLPHPEKVMNGLDLLVHASIQPEAFGRVIVEGLACGVPVIASRLGAAPEYLHPGETGWLVDATDPDQIAKAILLLVQNSTLREKLRKQGRETFQKQFTLNQYVQGVLTALERA